MHTVELLFKHFFTAIEGPTQSSNKLQSDSVYNLIGKIQVDPTKDLDNNEILELPNPTLSLALMKCLLYNDEKSQKKLLRDDQMCLLVWTAKVTGIDIPASLKKFFSYKQEQHGFARWITSATGYLRIYCSVSGTTEQINLQQKMNLKLICEFIVAVYTPSWMDNFYRPSAPEGPQCVLNLRDHLLDAADFYDIPLGVIIRLKKIFIQYAKTWLCTENLALSVYSKENDLTLEVVKNRNIMVSQTDLCKRLWDKNCQLVDFLTSETQNAPCLNENDFDFWNKTMSSNISCERYVRKMKIILVNNQLRETLDIKSRIKRMINLNDYLKF